MPAYDASAPRSSTIRARIPGGSHQLVRTLAGCTPSQREAIARGVGNRTLSRMIAGEHRLQRQPDPNDPAGYDTLDAFLAGATVLSDAGVRDTWRDTLVNRIDRATGRAAPITPAAACAELGMTQAQLDAAIGNAPAAILRNGRISRSTRATVRQINDPSSAPAVIRAGLEKLQADTVRLHGSFPADYYVGFSRAITEAALRRHRAHPDAAIDEVGAAYGTEGFPQGRAVLQLYEALVPIDDNTHFDKVQHFIRSMSMHYNGTGITTDIAQYAKEIVYDEIPSWFGSDTGFDWADMLANNRGQAYAIELYRRYHPVRDMIYSPTTIPGRVEEAGGRAVRDFERNIYRLYGVPSF